MIEVLANAMVIIILQYINVLNQHAVTLNLHNIIYQLYLNKTGGGGKKLKYRVNKEFI